MAPIPPNANPPGRPLSGMEAMWLAADAMAPPFAIQLLIEGHGAIESLALEQALRALLTLAPGLALRCSGWPWSRRWVPGPPPPLRLLPQLDWAGQGSHPAIEAPLQPWSGPAAEWLLLPEGPPLLTDGGPADPRPVTRLLLRVHHALTDGVGALLAARALFSLLRGEGPAPLLAGPTTDLELARLLGATPPPPPPPVALPPRAPGPHSLLPTTLAPLQPGPPLRLRRRLRWAGRDLLGQLVGLLRQCPGPLHIDLPMDLRQALPSDAPERRSTANLTGILHLGVDEPLPRPLPPELRRRAAGAALSAAPLRALPTWLCAALGRRSAQAERRAGRFPTSLSLTHLGRIDLAELRAPGFSPAAACILPPASPGLPLLLMSGQTWPAHPHDPDPRPTVELSGAAPPGLQAPDQLAALLDHLVAGLSSALP